MPYDPATDLKIARKLDAPLSSVWRCWSEPDLLRQWFVPAPAQLEEVRIDLRPGGQFFTRIAVPDGDVMASTGCFLLVEPMRRICFTDALGPDFRPKDRSFMTASIAMVAQDGGTLYAAEVLHADAENRRKHADMGFHNGWGQALEQLEALAASL